MHRTWFNPRATLTGLTLLCFGCALVPASWTRLLSGLHGPMLTLLAPIQSPVRWSVIKLRGPEQPEHASAEVREIAQKYDDAVQQLLQARRQIDDLRNTIRDLSRGADLTPDVAIRQLPAVSVIGPGGDTGSLFNVKAGLRERVVEGAVAVLGGVHLVGRVRSVSEYRCSVQPVTDPGVGLIDAVVTSDDLRFVAECQLSADRTGLLIGKVKESDDPSTTLSPAMLIAPGMQVRLKDASWPAAAQMLVLGRVEKIETSPEMARRKIVYVRPDYTLARAAEVTLRMPEVSPGTQSTPGVLGTGGTR